MGWITDEQLEKLTIAYEHSQTPHVTEEYVDAKIADTNGYINEMLGGKRLVYLTQAEYDILTEEEKNNADIVYNITDSSEEYVTTEQLDTTVEQINNKITESDIFVTDMTVINGIGGIESGSNLNGMTTLEILNKLIFPYVAPLVTVSGTPNGGLYEKGNTQTITNVRVSVTKKSEKITKIEKTFVLFLKLLWK